MKRTFTITLFWVLVIFSSTVIALNLKEPSEVKGIKFGVKGGEQLFTQKYGKQMYDVTQKKDRKYYSISEKFIIGPARIKFCFVRSKLVQVFVDFEDYLDTKERYQELKKTLTKKYGPFTKCSTYEKSASVGYSYSCIWDLSTINIYINYSVDFSRKEPNNLYMSYTYKPWGKSTKK